LYLQACEPGGSVTLRGTLTFVLKEVAHAGAAGEDKLGDVLDYLGLFLGGERGEPFGQTLRTSISRGTLQSGWGTNHFALPREQNEISASIISRCV
jgi:hypothetical protein